MAYPQSTPSPRSLSSPSSRLFSPILTAAEHVTEYTWSGGPTTADLGVISSGGLARARTRTLDPVENIWPQESEPRTRGHYRRQMMAAPRDGIWGTAAGMCGTTVLVRLRLDGSVQVVPALCDRWACLLCGPRKASWFKRELSAAQLTYGLDTFMTLTVDTKFCTAQESAVLITLWWTVLRKRLVRAYGKFSYIWAHEHTKRGYSHLHFLTTLRIAPAELSALWKEVTGSSFIVDVEAVESTRASDYLAKYCTEQATLRRESAYAHMEGRRFFSKSRDIAFGPFRTKSEQEGWRLLAVPYRELVARLRANGVEPIETCKVVPGCVVPAGDSDLVMSLGGGGKDAGATT